MENHPAAHLAPRYVPFFPRDFLQDPVGHLQTHARPRKPPKPHRTMKVFELAGLRAGAETLSAIAKVVTPERLVIDDREGRALTDPLLELRILRWLGALGLPGAEPIGHVTAEGHVVIVYRKVEGLTTMDPEDRRAYARFGETLVESAVERRLAELRPAYEAAGIHRRHWRIKDSVFRLDDSGQVTDAVPVDWERTQVDWARLDAALTAGGRLDVPA